MTPDQLLTILPNARQQAGIFLAPLIAAMAEFGITTPARQAAFIATLGHETGQLATLVENFNYGAPGLMATWPGRFPTLAIANAYARQPERIANKVYALREGNGDEKSGDGWRYRGAGGIQLTFANNQLACAAALGIASDQIGAWLRTPLGACRSAGWFWQRNDINRWADAGDFDGVSDVVNRGRKTAAIGDAIGYADRLALYTVAARVLH